MGLGARRALLAGEDGWTEAHACGSRQAEGLKEWILGWEQAVLAGGDGATTAE